MCHPTKKWDPIFHKQCSRTHWEGILLNKLQISKSCQKTKIVSNKYYYPVIYRIFLNTDRITSHNINSSCMHYKCPDLQFTNKSLAAEILKHYHVVIGYHLFQTTNYLYSILRLESDKFLPQDNFYLYINSLAVYHLNIFLSADSNSLSNHC